MSHIEKSIEVKVPVRIAYDQWTQFEEFPKFMEGVEKVRQIDDRRLEWTAKIGGATVSWSAEIREQVPDRVIAWRSTSGAKNEGRVSFRSVGPDRTEVTLRMDVDPDTVAQKAGDAVGIVSARVGGDLGRFKDFIESRQVPTGSWRGEIHGDDVRQPSARPSRLGEAGKVGLAILMWLLGVPGFVILLYLIFAK